MNSFILHFLFTCIESFFNFSLITEYIILCKTKVHSLYASKMLKCFVCLCLCRIYAYLSDMSVRVCVHVCLCEHRCLCAYSTCGGQNSSGLGLHLPPGLRQSLYCCKQQASPPAGLLVLPSLCFLSCTGALGLQTCTLSSPAFHEF